MKSLPFEFDVLPHRHWGLTVACFVAVAAVGVADYLTGNELTFSAFYLIPVAAVAWISGARIAVVASIFAAAIWFWAERASSRVNLSLFVYGWNFGVRLLFLLLVAVLLARVREMLERERELSATDALTGLPNARSLRTAAVLEIARSRRYGQPLSLAFIDVDDFKRVNDSAGHDAGDRVLKHVAAALRSRLRETDIVARYGGDEFIVLLPNADEVAARATAEKLMRAVGEAMRGSEWPVSVSVGAVTCASGQMTVENMLQSADRLMYEAKSAGKNRARFGTYRE
ncbi:MAG: GGDEF domain-containing protein [Betaproteobacteria bacterium]